MTFDHEIGHLFGAKHNRETRHHPNSEDYGHGYIIRNTSFCTIMAYERTHPLWNITIVHRIPYYSNPMPWNPNGTSISKGDTNNNNMRKLTETRFVQ